MNGLVSAALEGKLCVRNAAIAASRIAS